MNDIQQTGQLAVVRREEGRGQSGGREPGNRPSKMVAAAYQEIAKAKPVDDRITILGIPAEQITPATQAALASLVNEVNFLRAKVRRLESGVAVARRDSQPGEDELIPADLVQSYLSRALGTPPASGSARVLVLVNLSTCEDVRRSSGLLAANALLEDLAQRVLRAEFAPSPAPGAPATKFKLVGFAGGSTLVGMAEVPVQDLDETFISRQVRDLTTAQGFNVGGIDMAVALSVAAVTISPNEGAVTAMARADYLLRGRQA